MTKPILDKETEELKSLLKHLKDVKCGDNPENDLYIGWNRAMETTCFIIENRINNLKLFKKTNMKTTKPILDNQPSKPVFTLEDVEEIIDGMKGIYDEETETWSSGLLYSKDNKLRNSILEQQRQALSTLKQELLGKDK